MKISYIMIEILLDLNAWFESDNGYSWYSNNCELEAIDTRGNNNHAFLTRRD